jgi:CheY-like chemotaxis protein/HPt (histidine-containing phosphotransfer) domain-containing protein
MDDEQDRHHAFETRLAELKRRMEAGLVARAHTLREAVQGLLAGDESARKVLKQESHKLRGIAGSYGYEELTQLAAELERRASVSPPPQVRELANRLADAAEQVGKRSIAAQSGGQAAQQAALPPPLPPPPVIVMPSAPPPPSAAKPRGDKPRILGTHGGPLRVLAMDDDPTTLRLLSLTLKDVGGFDALLVTSAKQALEHLRLREFDVVISDAMMPDMNGQEFCRAARQLGGFAAALPIVILSAATREELEWHSALPGPVVWLRKPFMPSALVQEIARIVTQHVARAAER